MGKFIKIKELPRKIRENELSVIEFPVTVSIHGKNPHTEWYEVDKWEFENAKKNGYFNNENETEIYLDWKPMFKYGEKQLDSGWLIANRHSFFPGGMFKIEKYTFDERYVYAHEDANEPPMFALPKYLYDKIPGDKKRIFIGRRKK